MTDECKQKEAFVFELFETVPNSLYNDLEKKKKKNYVFLNIAII